MMRIPACVLALIAVWPCTCLAQTPLTGAWRVAGFPFAWEFVLRPDGTKRVLGAVSSCLSGRRPVEITDGVIEGNTVSFVCTALDGSGKISFKGTGTADALELAWEKHLEAGTSSNTDVWFGDKAPRKLVAKRVPQASPPVMKLAEEARGYPDVTFDRILHVDKEPQNWLTYSGSLAGHRFSPLTQITPSNVKNLELAWIWQTPSQMPHVATPLVAEGTFYTVQPPNTVVALNAVTGRVIWTFPYEPMPNARASGGGGRPNRGLAILGDKLFLGTIDAHLVAINAYTGNLVWNTTIANAADPACNGRMCYVITHAPLIVKDNVIVGVGGGEGSTRGFIAAYDSASGKEVWRFNTIPAPGEPGNDTWAGDSWKTGGAGVWNTGSYDPDLNLTYWGIGNPYPPWRGETREGDNLYSNCVVALDGDTGKLKWFFQFTPHDTRDWDSAQVPVLTDVEWQGRSRKAMLWANRNGLLYVLDRSNGQFLYGKPFAEANWLEGLDDNGRPRSLLKKLTPEKAMVWPGLGATNWWPPSYSPNAGLLYVPVWERPSVDGLNPRRGPGYGAMRAFDPKTGEKKWEFRKDNALFPTGALSTAAGLVFAGVMGDDYSGPDAERLANGYFYAIDARTGQQLWQMGLAGEVRGGPISYAVAGKQYIVVAAGNTFFAFALRQ